MEQVIKEGSKMIGNITTQRIEKIIQEIFLKHRNDPFCPEGKEVRYSEIAQAVFTEIEQVIKGGK